MSAEFEPLDSTNLLLVNFGPDEWDGGGTFDEQHYTPQGTAPVGSGYVTPFITTDFLSGLYMMNYTFYVRSRLRIKVYMDGVGIFGSPYHINCDSGPLVIGNCVAVSDVVHPTGLTSGVAGNAYFFRVWSRDLCKSTAQSAVVHMHHSGAWLSQVHTQSAVVRRDFFSDRLWRACLQTGIVKRKEGRTFTPQLRLTMPRRRL